MEKPSHLMSSSHLGITPGKKEDDLISSSRMRIMSKYMNYFYNTHVQVGYICWSFNRFQDQPMYSFPLQIYILSGNIFQRVTVSELEECFFVFYP